MNVISKKQGLLFLFVMLAAPVPGTVSAQQGARSAEGGVLTTVYGPAPADLSGLAKGPEIEGFISARNGDVIEVIGADGSSTSIAISEATEVRTKGGFLGTKRRDLAEDSLINGLPVTIKTVQWNGGLVASQVKFKNSDLKTASMIRTGTSQKFTEHDVAIEENAAATEALRGRVGDIDQYNIKGTTNVYFDTGKWALTPLAERDLCAAASQAEAMDNALLLVVGYTDSTGNQDANQQLSEQRAGRVVNHLQQKCGWKPWRMLTPTGMASSDPLASNDTEAGKAQNRRVSVNILVSKGLDGI